MARKSASPRRAFAAANTSDASLQRPSPAATTTTTTANPPRKRGRPRKSTDGEAAASASRPAKKARTSLDESFSRPRGGRPRPSIPEEEGDPEDDFEPPSRPGPSKKRVSFQPQQSAEQPVKRKRGRPSLKDKAATAAAATSASRASPEWETSTTRSNVRESTSPPPRPYPHVAPQVRSISQSTIDARWNPLSGASIASASETLALAHRPVMQRVASNNQRRIHTSSALSLLQRRITRKLQRGLPFPPPSAAPTTAPAQPRKRGRPRGATSRRTGLEAEMDFESVLDGAQALERQLEPILHAVELLRREKESMEVELEKDYLTLQNLEAGAKGQARERRDQIKRAHVLVPETMSGSRDDGVGKEGDGGRGALFKDLEDPELKELALQLGGHVDSMKTNLKQVDGLRTHMADGGTALRSMLLRYLDRDEYDAVVVVG